MKLYFTHDGDSGTGLIEMKLLYLLVKTEVVNRIRSRKLKNDNYPSLTTLNQIFGNISQKKITVAISIVN